MVSFTGSTATGRRFLHYSADSNLKRIVLECGGKNPAVVMDDAEDLDLVAEQVVNGAFWNMGENCSATSRLLVHASVKDELLQRMGAYIREWKMGDPLDPQNRVGSLVSPEHFAKVKSYLEYATQAKLEVAYGGDNSMCGLGHLGLLRRALAAVHRSEHFRHSASSLWQAVS